MRGELRELGLGFKGLASTAWTQKAQIQMHVGDGSVSRPTHARVVGAEVWHK